MAPTKKHYSPLAIINQNELARILNISVGRLQKMRKHPDFPRRRQFAAGTKGWLYQDIERFILNTPVDPSDIFT